MIDRGTDGLTLFQSTPSARRATALERLASVPGIISIHALREEGDVYLPLSHRRVCISIHALREEGDQAGHYLLRREGGISIHALREEGDSKKQQSASRVSIIFWLNNSIYPFCVSGKSSLKLQKCPILLAVSVRTRREIRVRSCFAQTISRPSAS